MFFEPSEKPQVFFDNSLEFGKACEDVSWNHFTSTHHRFETNGIAERAVRRIEEGPSAVLLESGLDEKWWLIQWHAFVINEIFKTCWQMRKDLMYGDSETIERPAPSIWRNG